VVIATILSTPAVVPVSTRTASETTFLGLMHANPNGDNTSLLYLGHGACADMHSTGDYAGYRIAVGKLMSAQEPPAYAQLMVHAALISGLCEQH